jgi:hypothetical protein
MLPLGFISFWTSGSMPLRAGYLERYAARFVQLNRRALRPHQSCVALREVSVPEARSQFMVGASRRRAAPGSQFTGAATGGDIGSPTLRINQLASAHMKTEGNTGSRAGASDIARRSRTAQLPCPPQRPGLVCAASHASDRRDAVSLVAMKLASEALARHNPSLDRTPNGIVPRRAHVHDAPRGAMPSVAAPLQR